MKIICKIKPRCYGVPGEKKNFGLDSLTENMKEQHAAPDIEKK